MASPKIVIATMLWKRHDLFRAWAKCIKIACPGAEVLVAGSEGKLSRRLVERHGFHYLETPNAPLGRKANLRFKACKDLDPDFVVLCGSDDIVSPGTWEFYKVCAREGIEEVAFQDIYYLHSHSGQMGYSPGYLGHRRGEPIAPWRMLSRRVCEKLGWHGWAEGERLYLDQHIYRRLKNIPHSRARLYQREDNLFMLDIKSQVNLSPWSKQWPRTGITRALLAQHLPQSMITQLDKLRGPITNTAYLGVSYLRPRPG
jgi:hypothetical protein